MNPNHVKNLPSAQSYFFKETIDTLKIKEDITEYAKYKWPLLFSRFYEALRIEGPLLQKNDIILAINWTGIYMVDDQEQVMLELSFPEITKAESQQSTRPFMQNFVLTTVREETFVFQSPNSADICELVNFFIDGLKCRTRYVIANQNYRPDGAAGTLAFQQGDLMILDNGLTGDVVANQSWVTVWLDKTGEKGEVPTGWCSFCEIVNKTRLLIWLTFRMLVRATYHQKANKLNVGNLQQHSVRGAIPWPLRQPTEWTCESRETAYARGVCARSFQATAEEHLPANADIHLATQEEHRTAVASRARANQAATAEEADVQGRAGPREHLHL